MTRLMMMTTAAALALGTGPALAQSQDDSSDARVRIDADGTTDIVDVTPDQDRDYAEWTPRGNLVAYDVDGDGWVAYTLAGKNYVVHDQDGDGYVLRTDVAASSDSEIDVITVEYDPSRLEPMTGNYDSAYLVSRASGERMHAEDVSVTEGGRQTLLADSDDLVVDTDQGLFIAEDGETFTLAEADVTEAWAAPATYTFVDPDAALQQRAQYSAEARTKPSNEWVAAPMLQVFRAMDSNDNMQVSYQEWGEWQADDGFHADRFGEFDSDGNRTLGWEEYRASVNSMYDLEASGS